MLLILTIFHLGSYSVPSTLCSPLACTSGEPHTGSMLVWAFVLAFRLWLLEPLLQFSVPKLVSHSGV